MQKTADSDEGSTEIGLSWHAGQQRTLSDSWVMKASRAGQARLHDEADMIETHEERKK
jgi:hypothetical protein